MDRSIREALEQAEPLFTETRGVRFQDVDAAGIVFFARFFDYFHDAQVAFLRERDAPLEDALRSGEWAAPLRHAEAEYLRPLRFGDDIRVSIVDIAVAETEFTLGYRISTEAGPVCVGRTRHVSVDPVAFRRTPLPDRLRRALEPGTG